MNRDGVDTNFKEEKRGGWKINRSRALRKSKNDSMCVFRDRDEFLLIVEWFV